MANRGENPGLVAHSTEEDEGGLAWAKWREPTSKLTKESGHLDVLHTPVFPVQRGQGGGDCESEASLKLHRWARWGDCETEASPKLHRRTRWETASLRLARTYTGG